jgi:hypothetical protein
MTTSNPWEVYERLVALETRLEAIQENTEEIKQVLQDNGRPGLVTRVDWMEQRQKSQTFWVETLGVVGVGAVAKGLIDLWTRWGDVLRLINKVSP